MADILIRGMEMPKTCGDCPLSALRMDCKLTGRDISHDWIKRKIPDWCPLIPIPEGHGRLGDLDALSKEFERLAFLDWNQKAAPYSWAYAYSEAQAAVDDSPTIVPAEGGGEE